jgi:SAM-dependent methyltransferase
MSIPIDLIALKNRQMAAWASGDYAVIGTTLQIVGEQLAEACDLLCDEQVLDVAAGNGNATLAAARRGCIVTSTDYVAALLERGEDRARAERLNVTFQVADAEALPFEDASFDAVLSTFGQGGLGTGAGLSPGRQDRPRQLDAGRIRRPDVQDPGPAHATPSRRTTAVAVGH